MIFKQNVENKTVINCYISVAYVLAIVTMKVSRHTIQRKINVLSSCKYWGFFFLYLQYFILHDGKRIKQLTNSKYQNIDIITKRKVDA